MISLNEIISVCILFITSINSGYIVLSRQDFNAHNLAFSDFFFGIRIPTKFSNTGNTRKLRDSTTVCHLSIFFFVFFKDIEHYGEIFNVFMSLYCCCNSTILCQLTCGLTFFKDLSKKKKKDLFLQKGC